MKKLLPLIFLIFLNASVLGGTINIITIPENASVYINGEYYGQSPCNVSINKSWVWTHTLVEIEVKKTDYYPNSTSVFIPTTENIILKLSPINGTLYVSSTPPGANVYLNGIFKGTTPLNLSLKPGEYSVTPVLKDYRRYSTTVEISPNGTKALPVELEPLNGTLSITSIPSNASVYINGTLKGTTPLNLSLEPGVYLINVTEDGSWNATTVTVKPNNTLTISLTVPEKGLPLALIFGALALLVGGGAGGYFLMAKKRENEDSQKSRGAVERAPPGDVITVKSRDGRAFGISHVGGRDNNEDNLLVMELPDAHLLAVVDGLGGHNAGEVASQMAVDALKEVFEQEYQEGMGEGEVKELLEKAYRLAHKRISENAVGEREGMGTTLVTAFVRDGKAIITNTGDSRAYLIRDGKVVARTKDHSLVQELIDNGEITPEEARRHPMRNIITKALGVDFGVDFYEWELKKGDVLLLSSDGLHDYVDEGRIAEIASQGKDAEEIVRGLIEEALLVTRDNVTVVVLRGEGNGVQ